MASWGDRFLVRWLFGRSLSSVVPEAAGMCYSSSASDALDTIGPTAVDRETEAMIGREKKGNFNFGFSFMKV